MFLNGVLLQFKINGPVGFRVGFAIRASFEIKSGIPVEYIMYRTVGHRRNEDRAGWRVSFVTRHRNTVSAAFGTVCLCLSVSTRSWRTSTYLVYRMK